MSFFRRRAVVIVLLATLFLANVALAQNYVGCDGETQLDPKQIAQTIKRVADWQLDNPAEYPPGHWAMAALYDGLLDVSLTTGDPKYLAAVIRTGRRAEFAPGAELSNADSHAVGHTWLRIYLMNPERESELLAHFEEQFGEILKTHPIGSGWSWVDALYMAPPTLVRLAQATGDERYLDLAHSEFIATYTALFDHEDKLFYRDERYFERRTPNGEKVFWSRGNGWAYAGLAEVLNGLPGDHPSREFYIEVFEEMSPAVLQTQQPDGLWYPSLLDPEHVPIGETSGSALFVFGLAWGINQGILDRETYLPSVERGWNALVTKIRDNGEVIYVQPVGAEPKPFDPESNEPYGTPYGGGALLGSGAEILRLLDADAEVDYVTLWSEAESLADNAPDLSLK
jgi:unsaturated rhamnogalacturonyl hydrolase